MKEKDIYILLSIVLFIAISFFMFIFFGEDMNRKKIFDYSICLLILLLFALLVGISILSENYTGETVYLSKEDLHCKNDFESAREIYIDKDIANIPYKYFSDFEKLQCVVFEGENTAISPGAFEGCTSLERVYLPSKLTKIRENTFKDCDKLEEITIPDSVTRIGAGAFAGCKGLTSVTIGSGVEEIGAGVFKDCKKLKSVTFEDTNGWHYADGDKVDELSDSKKNAENLKNTLCDKYWYKQQTKGGGK